MKSIVESFYNWYSNQIRHPKYRWFIVLGTLAYLLSPIDISPDFIPILGWIDDGVMITLLTTELSRLLIEQRNRRSDTIGDTQNPETAIPIEVDATAV